MTYLTSVYPILPLFAASVAAKVQQKCSKPTLKDIDPVRRSWRYLSQRRDRLDYASAISQSLPIESGEIESTHRYIGQKCDRSRRDARLKARCYDLAFPFITAAPAPTSSLRHLNFWTVHVST